MKRIYLAGPISLGGRLDGTSIDANLNRFHEVAAELRRLGYHVENPAETPDTDPPRTWREWMNSAIAQLITCDTVMLLPGWHLSRGAKVEHALAVGLGMARLEYEAWRTRAATEAVA